jgi:hypothetical protein
LKTEDVVGKYHDAAQQVHEVNADARERRAPTNPRMYES